MPILETWTYSRDEIEAMVLEAVKTKGHARPYAQRPVFAGMSSKGVTLRQAHELDRLAVAQLISKADPDRLKGGLVEIIAMNAQCVKVQLFVPQESEAKEAADANK